MMKAMTASKYYACIVASVAAFIAAAAGTVENKTLDDWYASILAGSLVGFFLGVVLVVLLSLPLCCGILKEPAKIIAGVGILLGFIIQFIPAIAGAVATSIVIDKQCKESACTDADKKILKETLTALGVFVAYTLGHGWTCIIIGITIMALGCCVFCKCCKMKDENPLPGMVVGGQAYGAQPYPRE